jgi:effector-binding domain-containing protein
MKIIKLLIFNLLFISNYLMATEEPEFNLVKKIENFEIREYSPKILAQVNIKGNFDDASNQGFKILADYIFGNNVSIDGKSKIEMTAPVVVEPISEVIAMTAPVITEGKNKEWIVSFVMPKEYALETLPQPNNKDIKIISLQKERYAVIVFTGLVRESSYKKQIKHLDDFISNYKLETIGKVQIARYNPPWILPFFRRNELMIKIK